MASSKTLTPTNVTISIPAMTDIPDASVFSNCVDKEADAINTLNTRTVLTDSNAFTFASGATDTSVTAAICNRVVYMRVKATFASLTNGTTITSGNIDSRLVPYTQAVATAINYSNGQPFNGSFWVYSDATIRYYGATLTNATVVFTITYIAY